MNRLLQILPLALSLSPVFADFLGPNFKAPSEIAGQDSLVRQAWDNFTSAIDAYAQVDTKSTSIPSNSSTDQLLSILHNITFSVGAFSINDPLAAGSLQYHHTSDEVAESDFGVDEVNGLSIYRLQSITKVFTVHIALQTFKSSDWDRPLSDFFPEGTKEIEAIANLPVGHIDWNTVTPRSLASHSSGISNIAIPLSAASDPYTLLALGQITVDEIVGLGLPPPNPADPTWSSLSCIQAEDGCLAEWRDEFIRNIGAQPREFASWQSPLYSNTGFLIFARVVESVSGKSLDELFQESIFEPYGLADTRSDGLLETELSRAAILGNATDSYAGDANITKGSGGLLSTICDLAKFGTGLLNSTVLAPEVTRRWMKPVSHTSHLDISFGTPWEIIRWAHPQSGVVTDVYTKAGSGLGFASALILIPDFGLGFSYLSAGSVDELVAVATTVQDLLLDVTLPAVAAQAKAETAKKLAGTYVSMDKNLNSSISFEVDETPGMPEGLFITEFISNSTDMLSTWEAINAVPMPNRLVPVGSEGNKLFMRALTLTDHPKTKARLVTKFMNSDHLSTSGDPYGGLPMNLYVFTLGSNGTATSVSPVAWRVDLEHEQ